MSSTREIPYITSAHGGDKFELAHRQRMERMDGCKVIRMPPRIKLDKEHTDHPYFNVQKIILMRRFLSDNNVDLAQLLPALVVRDHENPPTEGLLLATAYNATILDQQRKIMRKRGDEPFTFCNINVECGPRCKFRVKRDENLPKGGCICHDIVKTYLDEDPNTGHNAILAESRLYLQYGPLPEWRKDHTWDECVQKVKEIVHDNMDEAVGMLEDWIAMVPSRPPRTHFDEKCQALDVQYKILHCLLTLGNSIKQAIKSDKKMWGDLEDCFMEIFKHFNEKDLYRLRTEDDGIWFEMFGHVCDWAEKEHIFPRLGEARQAIANASPPYEDSEEVGEQGFNGLE
ncbi:hypothetical protein B0T20DRAFT_84946 [Sordaria brevicollis]|uniref:Uncharacterized protein n=1 Tax=Sordaria brevicollis TaxID=83679 RepID=A0AAE0P1W9_SORBR|nr:hypothetical protein B0T20DRAFT_84946 [Sordaria brevicollis]